MPGTDEWQSGSQVLLALVHPASEVEHGRARECAMQNLWHLRCQLVRETWVLFGNIHIIALVTISAPCCQVRCPATPRISVLSFSSPPDQTCAVHTPHRPSERAGAHNNRVGEGKRPACQTLRPDTWNAILVKCCVTRVLSIDIRCVVVDWNTTYSRRASVWANYLVSSYPFSLIRRLLR